jgi:hypothetical protein
MTDATPINKPKEETKEEEEIKLPDNDPQKLL